MSTGLADVRVDVGDTPVFSGGGRHFLTSVTSFLIALHSPLSPADVSSRKTVGDTLDFLFLPVIFFSQIFPLFSMLFLRFLFSSCPAWLVGLTSNFLYASS